MAMAELARNGGDEAISLSVIAERQHLSSAYLEQIFGQLRRAGLVDSVRGRSGGYRLSMAPKEISVAAIMVAVEEETRMTRCVDTTGEGIGCLGEAKCLTHSLWHALGDHIRGFLEAVTLQDVLDGVRRPVHKWASGHPLVGHS